MIWILFWKADNPAFKVSCFIYNVVYHKIPIISPGAYFWSKGLFQKFFLEGLILGGGGGGAYTWTNTCICILKTLFFVQAIMIF